MKVLVTGGLGYIGSHTTLELLREGHKVLILDNLENSFITALGRVARITGIAPQFMRVDMRDLSGLDDAFRHFRPEAVIHFAAKKSPSDSFERSLEYYDTNVFGTFNIIKCITRYAVKLFVFSSSAAVYGNPEQCPITEQHPVKPLSPYARTKAIIESGIRDVFCTKGPVGACILRYFNPVAGDPSGTLYENSRSHSQNLFPRLMLAVESGERSITIHGNDFATRDGTGIRDYIHVSDLARGHTAALYYASRNVGVDTFNLGTGHGYSVLEVIHSFEEFLGRRVKYDVGPRRSGDPGASYADTSKAKSLLGWQTYLTLEDMIRDSWRAFLALKTK